VPLKSLNQLAKLRAAIVRCRNKWLSIRRGIVFGSDVSVSLSSKLRPARRGSITIGSETLVAFKTFIYTWDPLKEEDRPIRIGSRCFIGGGSMILPGVTIGDGCIVGGGSVVADDIPPGCIAGGNPARILRTDIEVGRYGRLKGADENSRRLWRV
jgi:maltose O-acetyltransferase